MRPAPIPEFQESGAAVFRALLEGAFKKPEFSKERLFKIM